MLRYKKIHIGDPSLPKAVSNQDAEQALARLKEQVRARKQGAALDLDRYLEEIDPERLFGEPVGPTADCLRLDDLEIYSASKAPQLPPHVRECEPCRQALQLYQAVKERSSGAIAGARPLIWLEGNTIDLSGVPVEFGLCLKTAGAITLDPVQVMVQGIFDEISCNLDIVDADELAGCTYTAKCRAKPSPKLLEKLDVGEDFWDRVEITGRTRSGQSFRTSDLVHFRVRRAPGHSAARLRD